MSEKVVSIDIGKVHVYIILEAECFFARDFIPRLRLQKIKPYHPDLAKVRLTLYWQRIEISWYFRPFWIWQIKVLNF